MAKTVAKTLKKVSESRLGTAARTFLDCHCSMHAAGLTYFAMLALVPALCCVLVAAKAFGVDRLARDQINMRIDAMIQSVEKGQDDDLAKLAAPTCAPDESERKRIAAEEFASQARLISNSLFERIDSFDIGTFGWIGFVFLLWTLISSLGMVEVSFNEIAEVPKPRPVWKRAYAYLFIMVVLPVLASVAMSVPILKIVKDVLAATLGATWLTKWVSDGLIAVLDSILFRFAVSAVFATAFFAFFFKSMPNCRVSTRSAVKGGAFTAVAFFGWMKFCAIAQVGIAKSSALYGSFAFLPIVLAWIYMSWQIVLFGFCIVKACEEAREAQ